MIWFEEAATWKKVEAPVGFSAWIWSELGSKITAYALISALSRVYAVAWGVWILRIAVPDLVHLRYPIMHCEQMYRSIGTITEGFLYICKLFHSFKGNSGE